MAEIGPEHGWTRHGHRCCDQATGPRPARAALAAEAGRRTPVIAGWERLQEAAAERDALAALSRMVVGWENIIGHDLAKHPEVVRVMARYREHKEEA